MIVARQAEQAEALRAFMRAFFQEEISLLESRALLAVLEQGWFASRDLPGLLRRLRIKH